MKTSFLLILLFVLFASCGNDKKEFPFHKGDIVYVSDTLYNYHGKYYSKEEITSSHKEAYEIDSILLYSPRISPKDEGIISSIHSKNVRYKTGKTSYKSYNKHSVYVDFEGCPSDSHIETKYLKKNYSDLDNFLIGIVVLVFGIIAFFIILKKR